MHTGIIDQLSGLERDVQRIERLLASNPDWQAFQALGKGGALVHEGGALVQLPDPVREALAGNRLFQARAKLIESIGLLQELVDGVAAPSVQATPEASPAVIDAADVSFRTKIKVKPSRDTGEPPSAHVGPVNPPEPQPAQQSVSTPAPEPTAQSENAPDASPQLVPAPLTAPLAEDTARGRRSAARLLHAALARRPSLAAQLRAGVMASGSHNVARTPAAVAPPAVVPADLPVDLPVDPPVDPPVVPNADAPMTPFAAQPDSAQPDPAQPDRAQPGSAVAPRADTPKFAKPANDDVPGHLELIRGMTPTHRSILAEHGVLNCTDIVGWTSDDVARFSVLLGPGAPISRDQWIEQAAILSTGGDTAHARRRAFGDFASLVKAPGASKTWRTSVAPLSSPAPQAIPSAPAIRDETRSATAGQPAKAEDEQPIAPPESETVTVGSDHEDRLVLAQVDKAQATLNQRIADLERTIAAIRSVDATRMAQPSVDVPVGPAEPAPQAVTAAPLRLEPQQTAATAETSPVIAGAMVGGEIGGEADVQIVRRAQPAAAEQPARTEVNRGKAACENLDSRPLRQRLQEHDRSLTPLARRLGHVEPVEELSPREYAAYQGYVEEASVQIVRHRPADNEAADAALKATPEATPEASSGVHAGDTEPDKRASTRGLGFGKYLKALTGE